MLSHIQPQAHCKSQNKQDLHPSTIRNFKPTTYDFKFCHEGVHRNQPHRDTEAICLRKATAFLQVEMLQHFLSQTNKNMLLQVRKSEKSLPLTKQNKELLQAYVSQQVFSNTLNESAIILSIKIKFPKILMPKLDDSDICTSQHPTSCSNKLFVCQCRIYIMYNNHFSDHKKKQQIGGLATHQKHSTKKN